MALSNSQYEEIMHEYNKRQLKSADELNRRTEEVIRMIPEYKVCLDKISSLSISAAKAKISGNDSALASLHKDIDSNVSRMSDLLSSAGYPDDYLTPSYVCKDCRDTGYIGNEKCHCFKQAEIDLLYRQSNIKDLLSIQNFEHFNINLFSDDIPDGYSVSPRQNMKAALNVCKLFIEDFPSGENIIFLGPTGVGKTYLANCIAKEILDRYHSVVYLSAIELFDYFSSKNDHYEYSGLDNSDNSLQIISCDLLIIDDLGTELINNFTTSKLFYCINQRLLEKRSTIISSNFDKQSLLAAYSERIFSRIFTSYNIINLIGDDVRKRK